MKKSVLLASVIITLIMTAGLSANYITNGDFELGNQNFTTAYLYNDNFLPSDPEWIKEQEYTVYTNPNLVHQYWASYGDHTSGTGNMLIVNAATAADQTVWQQTVTVTPGADYTLSYWLSSSYADNPANLQLSINSIVLGSDMAPGAVGDWQQVSYNWNSGVSTSATIRLVDLTRIAGGDDFAIDDIYFIPEPATVLLLGLGGLMLKKRKA